MTRPLRPIAEVAAEVMAEEGVTMIWVGHFGMLDDIYDRAYGPGRDGTRTRTGHPLNKHEAVMAAVRRSPKFERSGFIRSCYASARESRHPTFKLKSS